MESTDLLRTPLHDQHVALGARMVPFAGWSMPVQYAGVSAEHQVVRSAAGLFDVSHMGELELEGPEAGAVIDGLVTNAALKLAPGQALYTAACNEHGTILDDLIVYRRAEQRWLVVCNASNIAKMSPHFAKAADQVGQRRCKFDDASARTALLALQGPLAFDVLAKIDGGAALRELRSFRLCEAKLAGTAVTVARTGYTGEDGVELFCAWNDAPTLWDALLAAGAQPAGLAARDTLRLEAKLCLYGNDIDETTNPYEAGLGWVVKLDGREFLGKAALVAIKAAPLSRKLCGFEMVGRGIARHGYAIVDDNGSRIGECTSGSPSPTLGKNIGLGYVPAALSEPGSKIAIDCRGKPIEAVVVKTPFYKRALR